MAAHEGTNTCMVCLVTSCACNLLFTAALICHCTTFCKFSQPGKQLSLAKMLAQVGHNMFSHMTTTKSGIVKHNSPAGHCFIALQSHFIMEAACEGTPQTAKHDTSYCWLSLGCALVPKP